MAILFSNEIVSALKNELCLSRKSVQLITAFCKLDSIRQLAKNIAPTVLDKKIMLRFLLEDLIKKSTDFEVLDYCREQGWKIYVRFDLHAKTYIIDNKKGIIGSANMTRKGLTGAASSNLEMAALVDLELTDLKKIDKLYADAIVVDDMVINMMREQYQTANRGSERISVQWNNRILNLFTPNIESLFSHELPEKSYFAVGEYVSFLDMVCVLDIHKMQERFRWSNAYLWLLNVLKQNNGELYLGELSEKLHKVMISDPKPYRRNVKCLLSNMLILIKDWKMNEIEVDRPNYSQRVRIVCDT